MYGECHGHMVLDGIDFHQAIATHKNGVEKVVIQQRLKAYQDNDILFFRDGGDNLGVSEYAKQIADDYGIDYRTPICALHKAGNYGSIVGVAFHTVEEFHTLLKEMQARGADFIKIMASGILDFNRFGEVSEGELTQNELKEIVRISHEEGMGVMTHVNGSTTIKYAIEAGVDSIEHGYYMDDEAIEMLAEASCAWVPTLAPVANLLNDPKMRFDQNSIRKIVDLQNSNIKKAVAAKANIALGSDAGAYLVPHVTGLQDEFGYLSQLITDRSVLAYTLAQGETFIKQIFRRNHG